MKRLSVILPIYNVEPYLEKCLQSIEDQDIPSNDYEIICINDGSPDDSREVVIRFQKEFDNIILIDQENQGVSRARNNGIDNAKGKYLIFIDPDDYVDTNCFERILKTADEHQAQAYFLGFTFLNEDGKIRKEVLKDEFKDRVYPGIEAYSIARGDGSTDPDRMVAVLFETGFLKVNNLRYLPDVPYLEDGEFIARILCLAERCIFDGDSFYQRTTRSGSATNSKLFHSAKATNGFLMAASNLKRFQQLPDLNRRQREFLNQPICKFVVLVITSAIKPFSFIRIREVRKKLIESGFSKLKLDSVNKEYTKLGNFYNRSVYLLIIFQYLITRIRFLHSFISKNAERL